MMERLDDGECWNLHLHAVNILIEIHCSIAADIDKVEVKHQNVQTKSPEIKDQNSAELTSQMHVLEAKFKEGEFFRDHYSQEVDQLREELMDKILEIESLRKQLKDVVPADTFATTTPAG